MSTVELLALVAVSVFTAGAAYVSAELWCANRWRRAQRSGSLPSRARHAGVRGGRRRSSSGGT